MSKEFKREYKWDCDLAVKKHFGIGIALGNDQPKKDYMTAWWQLDFLFLCWHFSITLNYNYKPPTND